jgi:uncharacterized protein
LLKHPAVPYVAPFAVFMLLLAAAPQMGLPPLADQLLRIGVVGAVLLAVSRQAMDFRLESPGITVSFGVGVFLVWILPDVLFPGYRQHWLFSNSITGKVGSSIPYADLASPWILGLRTMRAFVLVPIVEELFWRGWLLRWLVKPEFERVAFGTYTRQAFWITAALFASEHGPYWDVGLAAGAAYNYWAMRTKRLGDCILAHGVTNLCLSAYTIATGKWEYWM